MGLVERRTGITHIQLSAGKNYHSNIMERAVYFHGCGVRKCPTPAPLSLC